MRPFLDDRADFDDLRRFGDFDRRKCLCRLRGMNPHFTKLRGISDNRTDWWDAMIWDTLSVDLLILMEENVRPSCAE